MGLTLVNSGTQSASVGTTHDLATVTSSNLFVFCVDAGAMTNGDSSNAADELELTISTKCLSGGTERVFSRVTFKGLQGDPQKQSIPVLSDISVKFQLKQVAGVGRSFPWKILSTM